MLFALSISFRGGQEKKNSRVYSSPHKRRERKRKEKKRKKKVPGPPLLPNVPQLFDIDVSGRKIKEMINKITEGQMKIISKNLAK